MNPETKERKRKELFFPKSDLEVVRQEIKRLKQQGSLGYENQVRLDQLQAVSRREFLKKLAVGGAATFGVLAIKRWSSPDRSVKPVAPPVTLRPAETKLAVAEAEELKPEKEPENFKQGICLVISEYNKLLVGASDKELKDKIGDKGFVAVYTKVAEQLRGKVDFPQITLSDFDSLDTLLPKFHALEDLASREGYYLHMMPISSPLTSAAEYVGSVMMIFGKKVLEQKRQVVREGKSNEYVHIVIDKEEPGEPHSLYETAQMRLSAFTYRRSETDPFNVVQLKWGYEISAQSKTAGLRQAPRSERDFAEQIVLQEYRNQSDERVLQKLTDRIMQSSWRHEEQHVLDEFPSDIEQGKEKNEELIFFKMIIEIRGLLAPIAKEDPKMGLLNIYAWMEQGDTLSQLIAKETAAILHDISGRDMFDLLSLSDQKLNRIGALALEGNDIIFNAILVKKVPIDSQEAQDAQQAFYVFAEEARSGKRNPK